MKRIIPIFLLIGFLSISSCEHYSDGTRVGVVQKFSKRGWLFKTWEGELQMAMPGTMSTSAWAFSVKDPAVADSLEKYMGKRVELHYNQVKWLNWGNNDGETDYFVNKVVLLN